MTYILTFIAGFILGCLSGVVVMCLCAAQKYDEWRRDDD